jgi:ferredoxin-type protein NapF
LNRRELFTAFLPSSKERKRSIRPPYTDGATDFSSCRECDAPCVEVCETKILYIDEEGFPSLSFSKSGCTYCGKCADVCPKGVLSKEKEVRVPARILIDPKTCSAWSGVLCFSCKEPCLDNAIRFEGLYKPVILNDRCTACGFCVSVCPVGAIKVREDVAS